MRVKENLEDDSGFPQVFFEFYVVMALVYRMPVFLLVFQNCDAEPVVQAEYKLTQEHLNLSNHIVININDILQKILPKKNLTPKYDESVEVSPEEVDLLFMIRMQDYESITIKTIDGKIETLEASKSLKEDSRIIDLISRGDYQDIEIKKRDGQIVCIRQKIIKKY